MFQYDVYYKIAEEKGVKGIRTEVATCPEDKKDLIAGGYRWLGLIDAYNCGPEYQKGILRIKWAGVQREYKKGLESVYRAFAFLDEKKAASFLDAWKDMEPLAFTWELDATGFPIITFVQ